MSTTPTTTTFPDPESSSASPEQAPESNNASPSPPRASISLPNYTLGNKARPTHFNATSTREEAAIDAKSLTVGDAAFILRSDRKWAYAIVTKQQDDGENSMLRFLVDKKNNRKSFPEEVWGKYIRVIKVDADELARLEAEDGATVTESVAPTEKEEEAKVEETAKDGDEEGSKGSSKGSKKKKKKEKSGDKSEKMTLILGEFSSEVGSWFSAKFGSSKKTKENKAVVEVAAEKEDASPPAPTPTEENEASLKSEIDDVVDVASKHKTTESEDAPLPSKDTPVELKITKLKSRSSSFFNALPLPLGIFNKKSKSFEETKAATTSESDAAVAKDDEESGVVAKDTVMAADEETAETPATVAEAETNPSNEDPSTTVGEDETRDATEEKSTPEEYTPAAKEETATTSVPAEETAAAVEETSPEPEIPKPTPIKLLQTPIQFYKAATMTEDPAAAALAATSFADTDDNDYGLSQQGVTVVENDPSATTTAESLAHDRVYGHLGREGVTVVETNLRKQGITIVEAE